MSSHQLKYPQSCGSVIKLQKKKKVYCATCRKVQPVSSSALLKCPWAAFLCKSNPGWQQDLSEHGFWPDPCFEKHCLSPAFYIFSQLSRRNTLVSVSLPDLYICWPDSNTHTPTHTHTLGPGRGSSSTTPCETVSLSYDCARLVDAQAIALERTLYSFWFWLREGEIWGYLTERLGCVQAEEVMVLQAEVSWWILVAVAGLW